MTAACHQDGGGVVVAGAVRLALIGSPNAGKTSIFNGLTGLRAKTGNYPGVTVSRFVGTCRVGEHKYLIEDLPGTYSLQPVSPDEQVVLDVLDGAAPGVGRPDGLIVVVDATTLRRSLVLVAQVLARQIPSCVVVTFTDELALRQGHLDLEAFELALGVPVLRVVGHRGEGLAQLKDMFARYAEWRTAPVPPPTDPLEVEAWVESVLSAADYQGARQHLSTQRVDAVLLHPVLGPAVFLLVMLVFFQTVFTVAAPLQGYVESFFGWLAHLVEARTDNALVTGLLGDALIRGVGGVLVFVPQIMLLFLLLALLEGVGYMSRAAFLMDRVMARAGLEGRAFVALLSAVACAIPGIMATRTLPSAKDRIATMMGAPLMTCSARLPVYVLLIGMLVDPRAKVGPFGAQGAVMFGLYLLGAVSAMLAAWVFKKIGDRRGLLAPFYMEMPPYRLPAPRSVLLAMLEPAQAFIRKCSTTIVGTTIVLWLLLNLPMVSTSQLAAAGVDARDDAAVSAYVVDHSYAADLGRLVAPVFDPLGFDWRINVGVLSAQSARETFVATLGQVAAAENPDDPAGALQGMTFTDGEHRGEKVFVPGTIAALLVFFVYALQCMSTVVVMRRETGTWLWPAVAFGYMSVLAWLMAYLARTVTVALVG